VALALLQVKLPSGAYVIPTPQTVDPSRPFESLGFSVYSFACPYTEDQSVTNGDWSISAKGMLFARFFFANTDIDFTLPGAGLGGSTAPGFAVALTNNYRNFSLTHRYVLSSHLVNQAIVGYHRTLPPSISPECFPTPVSVPQLF
jgi:hypothetical protein